MAQETEIVPLLDDHDKAQLIERLVDHGYTDLATSVVGQDNLDEDRLKDALRDIDEQYAEHLHHKTLRKIAHA
ncbi:hypothetical protein NP511_17785 [Natrinema thermotolerans]|uniref:Uncharacterized protein n=1 Tax=Natrinema thermotolerans TaxID=121872 RepID=A0AAF0PB03_9EURY|nr:hypothetical protein [Natrinema thermotolerans]QCC60211.1 hypothetical protein DVR14_16875 [Natrinema thermotolerans]QCC61121.1 hypothetical protein DVR14_20995 [Natrinema thermotolerans]WMT07226.1 hypothetical protein NP511_17785 [Natrinema thermotolerans]